MENINNTITPEIPIQPIETPITPEPTLAPTKSNLFKYLFIISIFVLFIIIITFVLLLNNKNSKQSPVEQNTNNISEVTPTTIPTIILTPEPTKTNDIANGWKTYINKNYNFSLKYPMNYSINESEKIFGEVMGALCQSITLSKTTSIYICDEADNLTKYGLREPNGMDPISDSDLIIGGMKAKKYNGGDSLSYIVLSPDNNRMQVTTIDLSSTNVKTLEEILNTLTFN